jgi:enoyl-CoA hydratase/carnithine racemase
VKLAREGRVLLLSFGEGENRLDQSFLDEFGALLDEAEAASSPAALVCLGGARHWSNGYDLDWLGSLEREARRAFIRAHQALLARLLLFPLPSVAALSGHAIGGGALLALAHDYRVMRRDKGFFVLPEIDAGIPFRQAMVGLLRAKLPPGTLRDAVLTGRRYDAVQARADGIVDETLLEEELLPAALARAAELAEKDRATFAAMKLRLYGDVAEALTSGSGSAPSPPG